MASPPTRFTFSGDAASYLGAAIGSFLITAFTLGICYPFSLVLMERWRCEHTFVDGQQLIFNGQATQLFGQWITWLALSILTLGVYLFWVGPKLHTWKTRNTGFAVPVAPISSWAPNVLLAT